jgi:hypothetical protein
MRRGHIMAPRRGSEGGRKKNRNSTKRTIRRGGGEKGGGEKERERVGGILTAYSTGAAILRVPTHYEVTSTSLSP